MEEIPDDKESVRAALGNSVILRQIFVYLSLKDLKECCLVNKIWNFEARSYIRDFRDCVAQISGKKTCHRLSTFNQVVSEMTIVPIDGLKMTWSYCDQLECKKLTEEDPTLFYGELLEKLPLKYLRIALPYHFEPDDCPMVKFIITLLRESSNELQTLEVFPIPPEFQNSFDQDWTPSFPKLRVLDLGEREGWTDSVGFFTKIINGAPNLQKLKGFFYPFVLSWLPEEYYSMLDHLRLTIYDDVEQQRCLQVAEAGPSLSSLHVDGPGRQNARYKRNFFHCLEELLKSSRNSLQELNMRDKIFALNQLKFPPLVNLKKLIVCSLRATPELINLLEATEYSKQLPVLTQVELDIFVDGPNNPGVHLLHGVGANDPPPTHLHVSSTVKKLRLKRDATNWPTCRRLSKIYPNVRDIEIFSHNFSAIPYEHLCFSWPELESIYLKVGLLVCDNNFDAEFLGLYPSELDLLKELDDEALGKMNIVRARPSVLAFPRKFFAIVFFKLNNFER